MGCFATGVIVAGTEQHVYRGEKSHDISSRKPQQLAVHACEVWLPGVWTDLVEMPLEPVVVVVVAQTEWVPALVVQAVYRHFALVIGMAPVPHLHPSTQTQADGDPVSVV